MANTKSNYQAFYWNALERFGNQGIQFVIGIVLARILSPTDYGLVGLLLVFTAVAQIFIDSGFTKALIQRNDKSDDDLSTAFTSNLVIGLVIYVILWIAAPYIAAFYEEEVLKNLLRALSLILIINALFAIPNTVLTIDLEFKTIAKINSVAVLVSGIVAIILAMNGFGVWSLVLQYLLKAFITLILFTIKSPWKYRFYFSKSSFKTLFSFGSNLMASSLLNVIVSKFSSLFIAKVISTPDLGYYTRGIQFPDVAIGTLGSVLDTVLLPTLAKFKEPEKLKEQSKRVLELLSLLTIPITFLLAVLAEPIVLLLLTEKWINAVPILQLFCLSRFVTNLSSVNINLLYVINKPNLVLRQQYSKMAIRVALILIALPFGIVYIALAEVISSVIHFAINAYYPGKLLNFGLSSQLRIIGPYILIGSGIYILLFFIERNLTSPIWEIPLISIIGILLYAILINFLKKEEAAMVKGIIKDKLFR
tara:strand:+ start:6097 stop:7530 length:1434 start_codon:yes stop_codon:yes gene_type:complete